MTTYATCGPLTIADLIRILATFPQDAQVAITYESVVDFVDEGAVYLSADGTLLIGEEYKENFISGEMTTRSSLYP